MPSRAPVISLNAIVLRLRRNRWYKRGVLSLTIGADAMKKLFALTLCVLLTSSCHPRQGYFPTGKGSTMTLSVQTQAELDQANQRINAYNQELLRQGFREVSISTINSAEVSVLEGRFGRLKDLVVTLKTNQQLEEDKPEVSGGIHASLSDPEADKEFDDLYKKVVLVVTGRPL